MKTATFTATCAAVLLLAACGGADDATPPAAAPAAADTVPDAASQSVSAAIGYLVGLSRELPEDKESLAVARWAPPRADADEATALR